MEYKSKYYEKLSKLKSESLLCIIHDCVDLLQPISPTQMAEFDNISKKQVFNRIELGKYMIFNFDGRKYPIVNWHIKNNETI